MRPVNLVLRSVAKLALSRRSTQKEQSIPDVGDAVPRRSHPLHIAATILIIAKHRRAGISVIEARKAIQELAAVRSRRLSDSELVDDLVSATGLELDELAEVTKEWLPW
jgi:hypothetical protein